MFFIGCIVSSLIFLFSFLSVRSVLLNAGLNPILEAYTIASATLLSLISLFASLNYKKLNASHCKLIISFERKLVSIISLWNVISFITFFLSVTNLSSLSSHGAYSLCYLCIFNAPLYVVSICAIVQSISKQDFYYYLYDYSILFFFAYFSVFYWLGDEYFNSNYSFTSSCLFSQFGIVIAALIEYGSQMFIKTGPITRPPHVTIILFV